MLFEGEKLKETARSLSTLLGKRATPVAVPDAIIEAELSLPICRETSEETGASAVFEAARNLARQGDWAEISALIMVHDRARDMTPDGTPLAELVSAGARSDLVLALQTAARQATLSERHATIAALEDFCEDLNDPALGYGASVLAADTMMDAGWAWYEQGSRINKPEKHLPCFVRCFHAAAEKIAPFSALEENAPALAATNCALLAGQQDGSARVLDEYEDLIDLNPRAPGHMRAFGLHLLPQWFGTHATLEVQARRAAVQTQDVWGSGGYTWVWLDALALDPTGFAYLDMDFFLEGIDDILVRRSSQHYVNLFAAYLSRYIDSDDNGPDKGQRKAMMRRRAGLVRGRMQELHPWVWAMGPLSGAVKLHMQGNGSIPAFEAGHKRAQAAMAQIFASELSSIDLKMA
ncbi:hypothetical protein ACS3SW_00715 [Roseobacteraceae bacterium S113]